MYNTIEEQNRLVDSIIAKLSEPQNRDLLLSVLNHRGRDDSFMFTFTKVEPLSFDDFSFLTHQMDVQLPALFEALGRMYEPDMRLMSVRYDEYLNRPDESRLNKSQSSRFNALIDAFDDGWSGALYGLIMRSVQTKLRKMFNN